MASAIQRAFAEQFVKLLIECSSDHCQGFAFEPGWSRLRLMHIGIDHLDSPSLVTQ